MLLKIKVSMELCLVSVVVLMRGCSGTDEYEAGKEKITVYSLQKTRLHHCSWATEQVYYIRKSIHMELIMWSKCKNVLVYNECTMIKMFLNHNIQLHKTNYIIYLFHNLSHIICVKSNTSLLVYCLKYSLQQETAVSWMYNLDRFFVIFQK